MLIGVKYLGWGFLGQARESRSPKALLPNSLRRYSMYITKILPGNNKRQSWLLRRVHSHKNMNLLLALGTHRLSFTFTKYCLVSLYFPRWLLWFRKKCVQLHNTKAKSCLLSPCSKASVPIPWGRGSSSLFRGSASPVLGTHGTSHGAGQAEWGWCRARNYTKPLACAQPRKQHLGYCVWSDDALGLGGRGGLGFPSAWACQPHFPSHRDTRSVTQSVPMVTLPVQLRSFWE